MALLGGQFKSATHGQFKSAQGGQFDRILHFREGFCQAINVFKIANIFRVVI